MTEHSLPGEVEWIFNTATIRQRCGQLRVLAEQDRLPNWTLDLGQLPRAAKHVGAVIRRDYPDLQIPYHGRWRHLEAGARNRVTELLQHLEGDRRQQARSLFEMTIVSVLLDAGAGMDWRYRESGQLYSKSEGLALAAYHWFCAGGFSHLPAVPFCVTARGLTAVKADDLREHFQVDETNPLVGVAGRVGLLQSLGETVAACGAGFARGERLGELFDCLVDQCTDGRLAANQLLRQLLISLGPIWPGRLTCEGFNLGDTWYHERLADQAKMPGLIPFHKLTQWLSYSLLEVFEFAGVQITELDALTGLPEYRNGGLLMDSGVLHCRRRDLHARTWHASNELCIEWRALTVSLLDDLADLVRADLELTADELPLARVLQGGTWQAGRELAASLRADGGPPFALESDGTIF